MNERHRSMRRIQFAMIRAGKSVEQLADETGVAADEIRQLISWESLEYLDLIARVLSVPARWISDGSNCPDWYTEPPRPEIVADEPQDYLRQVPPEYRSATVSKSLAQAIADKKMVTLAGPPGTGKTSQMWAVWMARRANDQESKMTAEMDFQFRRYDQSYLSSLCDYPHVLLIDDIGFLGSRDQWLQQCIYTVLNIRRAWERFTVLSTNLTREECAKIYSPAVASRLFADDDISITIYTKGNDRRIRQ